MTMKLYHTTTTPFGRKVMVVAHELSLVERIEVEHVELSPLNPSSAVGSANPLGKVPVLITDEGEPLIDSRVIVEYLDHLAGGGRIIPRDPVARARVHTTQAIADGILDAGILVRYERLLRPRELQWPAWIDRQLDKVRAALDLLERDFELRLGSTTPVPDLGQIAVACSLGWLRFRAPLPWEAARHPRLTRFLADFDGRASMLASAPRT